MKFFEKMLPRKIEEMFGKGPNPIQIYETKIRKISQVSQPLVSNSNEDPGLLVYLSYKKSCLVVTSDDKARRKYN